MAALLDPQSLFSLEGKVAVVTGAAANIGRGTAILLANAGATVVVADKDEAGARATVGMLGEGHDAIAFDLDDEPSIIALFDEVERRHARCDVLINNAGIFPKYNIEALDRAQWDEMQRINVWGCFVALREAARLMRKGGQGGRIINVSSIGGIRTAVNDQIAYNASRAALDSMTKSAALEFAKDGILVNSLCPGACLPFEPQPREHGYVPPTGPLMTPGRILTGKPALTHEVAGPILMLASAAGGHTTGQCIIVDGGFSVS